MERNATFDKFGGTGTLIRDYQYWSIQVRPRQVTLGAMILLAHGPATEFSGLEPAAFSEMSDIIQDIETVCRTSFSSARINYLMLMMVDPHVHFHVLPRYPSTVLFEGTACLDPGWPGQPDLSASQGLIGPEPVTRHLRSVWPAAGRAG